MQESTRDIIIVAAVVGIVLAVIRTIATLPAIARLVWYLSIAGVRLAKDLAYNAEVAYLNWRQKR